MRSKHYFASIAASLSLSFLFINNLYAEGIADPAEGWNHLWYKLMVDIIIIGVIFAVVTLYLLLRYRRKQPNEEGQGPKLSPLAALGWALIPTFIFMADDIFLGAKNFELWNKYRNMPENAYAINLESAMWSWEFNYPEGIKATNELRVPAGEPIMLKMTSRDVVHNLFIPEYKVKWEIRPGTIDTIWFYPKKTGEYVMTCVEFCGVLHSSMYGKVIVMQKDEFSKWIEAEKKKIAGGA